jgi:hypothetical protein
MIQTFFQKSGSVRCLRILISNFMPEIRKIHPANSKINSSCSSPLRRWE